MSDIHIPGTPTHSKNQGITKEKLESFLPRGVSRKATDEVLTLIKNLERDTHVLQEHMEENVLAYMHVLKEVKVDLKEYVNAIKYCTLKQNLPNTRAWAIVFPDQYDRLVEMKKEHGDKVNIDSHASNYNKSKIVTKIDAMMLVPPSILYAPMFHAAVQKQYNLMNGIGARHDDRVSAHVQHLAAKELAEMTKMPEDNTIELKVGMTDEAKRSQDNLFNQMQQLAQNQQKLLEAGHSVTDIQKLGLTANIADDAIDADLE